MNKHLFCQLVMLTLMDIQKMGFGVFITFHGHVNALDIRIHKNKDDYKNEPIYKDNWFLNHCDKLDETFARFVRDMKKVKSGVEYELH